ncbi:ABC transporter permease [Spiroplasma litorale]|uniref:ABC transporter permease n=1 Tax=Spiroplasma litorale TaxID=216942 RepID=A0A0K1W1X7_9MOLU|nr:hypothetical protein [Spiroplasma litorale]AKX34183.1 ABC transporter permease [Spiroplasma litorale]
MKEINLKTRDILKFSFRILFTEKTYIIFFTIINIFSILVAIVFANTSIGKIKNQIFDFYVIIFINVFLFLLILRVINFFFIRKSEDKTIFIILSNTVSRMKFFLCEYLTILIIISFSVVLSFLSFNIIYLISNDFEITNFVIRKTSVFLGFTLILTICLINFIIFLIFFAGAQPTLIISTILMSLSFIANIPAKLIETKTSNINFTFNDPKNNTPFALSSNDVYDSINFQNILKYENIKYKNLSKAINNYFTNYQENEDFTDLDTFKNSNKYRYTSFWNNYLNVINNKQKNYKFNGILSSLNSSAKAKNWKENDPVSIEFTLESYFKDENEIKDMINSNELDSEKKLILQDLLDLTNQFKTYFIDFKKEKSDLFSDFIFFYEPKTIKNKIGVVDEEKEINFIKNENLNQSLPFTKIDLNNIFQWAVKKISASKDSFQLWDNDHKLEKYFDEYFSFPIMFSARVVEEYFIHYTVNYYNSVYSRIVQNDEFKKYQNNMSTINILNSINPFYDTWSFYTKYSGFYFDDIWFNIDTSSSISLIEQENLFLPYVRFNLNLDNKNIKKDTYDEYLDPAILISIILVVAICLYILSIYKFTKVDVN